MYDRPTDEIMDFIRSNYPPGFYARRRGSSNRNYTLEYSFEWTEYNKAKINTILTNNVKITIQELGIVRTDLDGSPVRGPSREEVMNKVVSRLKQSIEFIQNGESRLLFFDGKKRGDD